MAKNIVFGLYKYVRENVSEETIEASQANRFKPELPLPIVEEVKVEEAHKPGCDCGFCKNVAANKAKAKEKKADVEVADEGKIPANPAAYSEKDIKTLQEDETKETVIGEFSDEQVAKEMASAKKGRVVQDPKTKKWNVIVTEGKKVKEDSKTIPGVEKSLKPEKQVGEPKKVKEDVEINIKTDEKDINIVDVPGGTQTTVIEKPAEAPATLAVNPTEPAPVSANEPKSTEMGLVEELPKEEEVKEEPIESKVTEKKVDERMDMSELVDNSYRNADGYVFYFNSNYLEVSKDGKIVTTLDYDILEDIIESKKLIEKKDDKKVETDPNRPAVNLLRRIHKAADKGALEHLTDQLEKDTVSGKIAADQETRLKAAIDRRKTALEANPEAPETETTEKEEKEIEECVKKPVKESADDFTIGYAESVVGALREVLGAEVKLEKVINKLKTMDRIGLESLKKSIEVKDAQVLKQFLNMVLENKEVK